MLRLSELYLIAAATAPDDATTSVWLEKLRMMRGYQSGKMCIRDRSYEAL